MNILSRKAQKQMGSLVSRCALLFTAVSCTTIPKDQHKYYVFPPEGAFIEKLKGETGIGFVRAKVNFSMLNQDADETLLCKNYFNKGALDLLKDAKKAGGTRVDDISSVVFYLDGKSAFFKTPECTFDTDGGQILLQGRVLK